MAGLADIRHGAERAWDNLVEDWKSFRQSAAGALTRFKSNKPEVGSPQTFQLGLLAADVTESEKNVVVKLEIPGMEKQDFHLSVVEKSLVVKGEKHSEVEESENGYHILERAYGSFSRVIPLPSAVNEEATKAQYKKGVLTVTLPKVDTQSVKKIRVDG